MDWNKADIKEGLDLVANVYQMVKAANRQEALRSNQDARQQLGILGIDEKSINDLAGRHARGEISDMGAQARFPAARFTSIRNNPLHQLFNTPAAVTTALSQGRAGDAAAQADVLGLKNLANPFTGALPAAAIGGITYGIGNKIQGTLDKEKALHGMTGDKDFLKEDLKGNKGGLNKLTRYRKANTLPGMYGSVVQGYRTGGSSGAAQGAWDRLKSYFNPGKVVDQASVRRAAEKFRAAKGRAAMPILAGLGAATAPLMASEWLSPWGYRSGRNPFNQLLQSNNELNNRR